MPTGKSVSVSCSCRAMRSCVRVIADKARAKSRPESRGRGVRTVSGPCPVHARSMPDIFRLRGGGRGVRTMSGPCPLHARYVSIVMPFWPGKLFGLRLFLFC